MGAAPPLLTLRDLLELACDSSCSDGFRSYPRRLTWHDGADACVQAKADAAAPVGLLIEADLRRSPSRTLSSILFPRSPGSLATVSRLTRTLSRRLVFWRRHRADDDDGASDDADERDSLGLPSPVVSSCSASECSEHAESVAEAAGLLTEAEEQASDESEKPSTSSGCTGSADDGAADGDGHTHTHNKAMNGDAVGSSVESMMAEQEQQQLSPVSVLDFPFHHHDDDDDDDGDERSDAGTCSPSSFQQCQPDLERSNPAREPPLHKIRRLDGLAQQAGVDPVDLDPRFVVASDESGESDDTAQAQSSNSSVSSTDDSAATTTVSGEQRRSSDHAELEPEAHHHRLFARLVKEDGTAAASAVASEWLLLDFFAEGLDRLRSVQAGPVLGTVKASDHDHDEAALVHAAKRWVEGLGTQWGVEDVLFAGEAALADMDRERRWMCVGVEEREVGVAVEELLMDALVAELVSDLAVRC